MCWCGTFRYITGIESWFWRPNLFSNDLGIYSMLSEPILMLIWSVKQAHTLLSRNKSAEIVVFVRYCQEDGLAISPSWSYPRAETWTSPSLGPIWSLRTTLSSDSYSGLSTLPACDLGLFRKTETQNWIFSYSKFPDFEASEDLGFWNFVSEIEVDCLVARERGCQGMGLERAVDCRCLLVVLVAVSLRSSDWRR